MSGVRNFDERQLAEAIARSLAPTAEAAAGAGGAGAAGAGAGAGARVVIPNGNAAGRLAAGVCETKTVDDVLGILHREAKVSRLDKLAGAVALEVRRGVEAPVYAMFGHGGDLVDEGAKRMPEGCVYVTSEVCGSISFNLPVLAFALMDPSIQFALKNPVAYKDDLKQFFKFPIKIHYHNGPGSSGTYIDAINTKLADLDDPENPRNIKIYKSGIVRLDNYTPYDKVAPVSQQLYKVYEAATRVTPEDRDEIFSGAEDASGKVVLAGEYSFAGLRAASIPPAAKLSDLFASKPGIYFNFACRSYYTPHAYDARMQGLLEERIKRRRRNSLNQGVFMVNDDRVHLPIHLPGKNIGREGIERASSIELSDAWVLKYLYTEYEDYLIADLNSPLCKVLINHLLNRITNPSYRELEQYEGKLRELKTVRDIGTIEDKIIFIRIWIHYLRIEQAVAQVRDQNLEEQRREKKSQLRILSRLQDKTTPITKISNVRNDALKDEMCILIAEYNSLNQDVPANDTSNTARLVAGIAASKRDEELAELGRAGGLVVRAATPTGAAGILGALLGRTGRFGNSGFNFNRGYYNGGPGGGAGNRGRGTGNRGRGRGTGNRGRGRGRGGRGGGAYTRKIRSIKRNTMKKR